MARLTDLKCVGGPLNRNQIKTKRCTLLMLTSNLVTAPECLKAKVHDRFSLVL